MKKQLVSVFLIWTILIVGVSGLNISAQTISKDASDEVKEQKIEQNSKTYNFGKLNKVPSTDVLDAPIDIDKIAKENSKPLPKQKMSKKQKTFWVLFAVGMAALVFVAIKYYKECEIEDPNCPIGETICPCLKYKDEK